MSCIQTLSGIARDCDSGMGGVKRILVANHAEVTAVTVADSKISTITMASSAKFKEYNFKKGVAYATTTLNVDSANGINFKGTDLYIAINGMSTAKRVEMEALAAGELAVIFEDNNGKFFYLGKDNPVTASAGTGQTGAALTDRNGYDITLHDDALEFPYEVTASIVDALIG